MNDALKRLQIAKPPTALGTYIPAKRVGDLIFVTGQLPTKEGNLLVSGPVPSKTSIEQARDASRQCVLNGLAAAATVVDIQDIKGVVRISAFINSDATFIEQSKVANGASEFLIELFGEGGRHVRTAIGVNTLPLGSSVEIEFIFHL